MAAPSVSITKQSAAAVQAAQAANGILAIIAPCSSAASALPYNVPTPYSQSGPGSAFQVACVEGPLLERGTYEMATANKPILAVRCTASTPGYFTNPLILGGAAGQAVVAVPSNGPPAHITVTAHGVPATLPGGATAITVTITGATGDTAIDGTWQATYVDANTLALVGVTGSGTYTASSATIVWTGLFVSIAGTAVPSMGSVAAIADEYADVLVKVNTGGTLGTGPITLQASMDGGNTYSPPVTITSALTFTPVMPVTGASTGVPITLGTSTETLVTGDFLRVHPVPAQPNSSDLVSALASLASTEFDWDLVFVEGYTTSTLFGVEDAWSTAQAGSGVFPLFITNTIHRNIPAGQTDAAFQTAVVAVLAGSSSINVCPNADYCDYTSAITGVIKPVPVAITAAARLESVGIGVDAAAVVTGPLPASINITGTNGQPKWHNEGTQSGLDSVSIGLGTLRTFSDRPGVYITNEYIHSGTGSAFVFAQNARVANACCAAAFSALTDLLSSGFDRNPKTGFILESEALRIEAHVQPEVDQVSAGAVSGVQFVLSRSDINLGNAPATLTGFVYVQSLLYAKFFVVQQAFTQVAQ